MKNKYVVINIGVSVFISWIIFEYIADFNIKKKLKKQLKKIVSDSKDKYKDFYQINFSKIAEEISSVDNEEKDHTINSFKKTFEDRSSSNLESYIKNLNLFNSKRYQISGNFNSNNSFNIPTVSIERMIWIPYISRIFFQIFNEFSLFKWKNKFTVKKEKLLNTIFYNISNKHSEKSLLLYIGFGGFLYPFDKVVDLFLSKGYRIIIPIYGPCQASLDYSFETHEAEFHDITHQYLLNTNCKDIDILCWSLGGILYKGFEQHINNFKFNNFQMNDKFINVDKIFMIEPLVGIRACTDTFFCQKRKYQETLDLMNSVTNKKYHNYNNIFSYFLHTAIGFSTGISFGFYASVELKKPEYCIIQPRYLFVSSDDIIFNKKLDKELINSNFLKENTYYRNGYHGGWLMSKKIIPMLDNIISN